MKSLWVIQARLPGQETAGEGENKGGWTAVEWAGPTFDCTGQEECCSF